ncbi:MAG: hypothetical protein M3N42_15760 [Cyanobacteriota bacterium]|nr:hypothetical protein [Cyanobacteriota bacterium]
MLKQEARGTSKGRRNKAEGTRQKEEMQILSLSIRPSAHPRLKPSLSVSSHLLRTDRGFLIREVLGAADLKANKPTLKNCIGE